MASWGTTVYVTEQLNRKKKMNHFPRGIFFGTKTTWSPKVRTQTYVRTDDISCNSYPPSLRPSAELLIYLRAF